MEQSNSTGRIGISLTWFGILEEKNEEEKTGEFWRTVRMWENWLNIEQHSGVKSLIKKKVEESNGQKTWTPTTAHASRDLGEVRT